MLGAQLLTFGRAREDIGFQAGERFPQIFLHGLGAHTGARKRRWVVGVRRPGE